VFVPILRAAVTNGKNEDNPEIQNASRGWNLLSLNAIKTPPEGFAAFVYVASTLILLPLIGFGLISSFRFAYETLVGDLRGRVEVAKVFFPVIVALIGGPILIWRAGQAGAHGVQ
jgi:hypothetical protein